MPGYLTQLQDVPIDGAADLRIRSLLDLQQFSDPDGAAARAGISPAAWPLFGRLWPSAAHLAARMARRPVTPGERILEVGCGLALASLVGHRRGADVTASDHHPLAGAFLAHNVALNALPALPYRDGDWTPRARPPGDPVHGRFGLIMGSDLLYERGAAEALAGFIGRHASDRSEVWLVDPNRGNRPAFTRCMTALGYRLDDQRLATAATGGRAAYRGHMLVYERG
jgi:predicted nicotinamide N-methyase